MKITTLASFTLLLLLRATGYGQTIPVIRANSSIVNVKLDGKLYQSAWQISPAEKLDIFPTAAKRVTFYTDIDSLTIAVDPAIGIYNFIILVKEKDSAHTQIKYDAAAIQNPGPTALYVRKAIEAQAYSLKVAPEPIFKVENRAVWNGTDSIRIRIYYSGDSKKQRIIYNVHGGAFVACNLETHDNICRILANKTHSMVIALDYRKAPESPFPASIDDCLTVLQWIKTNAATLGGDGDNLVLVGDSGGGLFVTALGVKLQRKFNARAVVLVNPAGDLRHYEQSTYALVIDSYLAGKDPNDSLASPITAKNFSFFPPTLVITCEKDGLKPQGLAIYNKLSAQGVRATTVDIPQQGHLASFWAMGHPNADKAIEETVRFILDGPPGK